MAEIAVRELRNDVSAVLRRVEAGERLRVTVRGRAVAELVPLAQRPGSVSWDAFWELLDNARADAELTDDLVRLLPDTTDDDGP